MSRLRIPTAHDDLSAGWLTAALRAGGAIAEAEVTAFDAHRAEDQGFFADITRLTLQYDGEETGAPASLILKLSSGTSRMRKRENTRRAYMREVQFYEHLQPHTGLPTPRCHYGDIDFESGYHVLLLEDLAPAASGSLAAGCTPGQALLAVQEIARFHGIWWESARLDRLTWMRSPSFDAAALNTAHEGWWPVFLERAGHHLTAPLIRLGEQLGRVRATIIPRLFASPPLTLIHRDYGLSNMMFATPRGGAPFTVIDWQTVSRGRGVWDVAWFLGQNLTIDHRRSAETGLLQAYHQLLLDNGVRGYSYDQCLHDYRLALVNRFGSLISTIAAMPFTEEQIQLHVDVVLPRNIAALVDHDAASMVLD